MEQREYASFFMGQKTGLWRLPLSVRCRIGNLDLNHLALLDTGAEWSVIGSGGVLVDNNAKNPRNAGRKAATQCFWETNCFFAASRAPFAMSTGFWSVLDSKKLMPA